MAFRARDIGLRAASALVLAPAAILATWGGGWWFAALIAAACILLAREWAVMSARGAQRLVWGAVAAALVAVVLIAHVGHVPAALITLVFGAGLAGAFARRLGQQGLDAAYGVLYLGWPAILFIWLRGQPEGLGWTVLLFMTAWSADVLAYLVGTLLKGPKLWPRFSPNKTWSGFIGGLIGGLAAGALMVASPWPDLGVLSVFWGALLGLAGAVATMAGDLWESALKRRYGVKDAGDLIPGHGGLMDRVDGLMFAVVVIAAGRVLLQWMGVV